MRTMQEQLIDIDKALVILEDKAEENFKVAEHALKAHNSFLNDLDGRLVNIYICILKLKFIYKTYEELMNKVCLSDLDNKILKMYKDSIDNN